METGTLPLDHLGLNGGMGEREKKREKERERESFRERSSTFSLNFLVIRPTVSGGAGGKVHSRHKSFALRPKLGSFDKLQEVGGFLLLGLIFV